jgi:hypothetical protein
MSTAIEARTVKPGMTVTVDGLPGEWVVLSRHPDRAKWWLHRWTDGRWETADASYRNMTQILRMPGE